MLRTYLTFRRHRADCLETAALKNSRRKKAASPSCLWLLVQRHGRPGAPRFAATTGARHGIDGGQEGRHHTGRHAGTEGHHNITREALNAGAKPLNSPGGPADIKSTSSSGTVDQVAEETRSAGRSGQQAELGWVRDAR